MLTLAFLFARVKKYFIVGESILQEINARYHLRVNFQWTVTAFFITCKIFSFLYKRWKPKAIFVSCYYGILHQAAIYTANKNNIKTIEIQHGLINNKHAAYNLFCRLDRSCFPVYLLAFGEYVKEVYNTKHWKDYAMEWFYTIQAVEQPFIVLPQEKLSQAAPQCPTLSEAQFRHYLASVRKPTGDITEWLHLGPFYFPPGYQHPIDFEPIAMSELRLEEGRVQSGRRWFLLASQPPTHLHKFYNKDEYCVSYSFVNIYSPSNMNAILHYANDDDAKIWLNEKEIISTGITGLGNFKAIQIQLKKDAINSFTKRYKALEDIFFMSG